MNRPPEAGTGVDLRRRLLEIAFWIALVGMLWALDTLTKLELRERTGVGLDDFRLIAEQVTSAAGVLVMTIFVSWWTRHFPLMRTAIPGAIAGHLVGSVAFSLGHYAIQIALRELIYPFYGYVYGAPASLLRNLLFEYQKDVKIYIGIVAIVTVYRQFLGGENRLQVKPKASRKMLVQTGSGEAVLRYEQIDFLESARNYVVIHADGREYLVRASMADILDQLGDEQFARTHRSFAVNLSKVDEIRSNDSGPVIRIRGGREIPLSRGYRDEFRAKWSQ